MKVRDLFETTLTQDFLSGELKTDSEGLFETSYKGVHLIGNWNCSRLKDLVSLEGSPESVTNSYRCADCINLESLEFAPKKVGRFFEATGCTKITSLQGIGVKYLEEVGRGILVPETVTSHMLGILKVRILPQIETSKEGPIDLENAIIILNKHLKADRNLRKCKSELEEAGLQEFAKL